MIPEDALACSQQPSIIRQMSHTNPAHTFPYDSLTIYFNILFSTALL